MDCFHAKLENYGRLTPAELEALHCEPSDSRLHVVRSELCADDADGPRLVTSGWVGLTRNLEDGRRQVIHVAIAGDIVTSPPVSDGGVAALTTAGSVDAAPLLQRLAAARERHPGLWLAWSRLQRDALRNVFDHVVRLGALTAYERIANLIVELLQRHEQVGLSDGRAVPWPISQEIMAEVVGLSAVHVNRILQQMRRDRLIELRAGTLLVLDPERLAGVGFVSNLCGAGVSAA
jgi:CRP-like cAMP-binding protein